MCSNGCGASVSGSADKTNLKIVFGHKETCKMNEDYFSKAKVLKKKLSIKEEPNKEFILNFVECYEKADDYDIIPISDLYFKNGKAK